jgi:hypothetical protein
VNTAGCRPQSYDEFPFEIDHIVAEQHVGKTIASNLAFVCYAANSHKGSNIAGLDPNTGKLTPLFNPCRQRWSRHFRWQGAYPISRTPVGRVTVAVLNINDPFRVALREGPIGEGRFSPA